MIGITSYFLKTDDSFYHYAVKFSTLIRRTGIPFPVIVLGYVFELGQHVFGQKPAAANVETIDFDVSVGRFTVDQVVTAADIKVFPGTESIQQFGSILVKGASVIGRFDFAGRIFIDPVEFKSLVFDEGVDHEGRHFAW